MYAKGKPGVVQFVFRAPWLVYFVIFAVLVSLKIFRKKKEKFVLHISVIPLFTMLHAQFRVYISKIVLWMFIENQMKILSRILTISTACIDRFRSQQLPTRMFE